MKVFALGGYGKVGLPAIKLLAASDLVTEIAVAGRNLERAEQAAREIGEKAVAVQADGTDEEKLASLLAGYDVVLNAAWGKTILSAIRAATRTGTHYCDVVSWGDTVKQVLQAAPEAAEIAAIIAIGISPCISNLMAVHVAQQLDKVEQLQIGRADVYDFKTGRELTPQDWLKAPQERLAALHEFRSFFTWMVRTQQKDGLRTALGYQDGRWVETDPLTSGLGVPCLDSGTLALHPFTSTGDFIGMLPTDLAKAPPMMISFSPLPPQLHAVLLDQVRRMLAGDVDVEAAVSAFYDTAERDPHHWLTLPDDFVPIPKMWVRALGHKGGRAARCNCWFTAPMWNVGGYFLTSVALAAAALKILRGEMRERGVMTAEKAFEPLSFFDQVVSLLPDPLPDGKMIDESFDWLE
jgi:hypothetical protein